MKDTLLDVLIKRYQQYQQETGRNQVGDLKDFAGWLMQQQGNRHDNQVRSAIPWKGENQPEFLAGKISRALGRLSRFAINYSKKALEGTAFRNVNDFIYLLHLLEKESLSKTELIQENVQEITTGVDIIKRLLRQQLVEQFDDPDDARSKRLRITPKGRQELQKAFPRMSQASRIVLANLDEQELGQLTNLLNKLDRFHEIIYLQDREKELGEILEKYF